MLPRRLLGSVFLLALLAGAGCAQAPLGEAGSYEVFLAGPDGPLWNGTVGVGAAQATPLGVLRAASLVSGLGVRVEETAQGPYVRAIGPVAETQTAGWCVFVDAGAGYVGILRAADAQPLHAGERVLWAWSTMAPGPC